MTRISHLSPLFAAVVLCTLVLFGASAAAAANTQPAFVSSPNLNAQAGIGYVYDADATDADGNTLTYLLVSAPAGMTIDGASGIVSWTPKDLGSFPVVVGTDDGQSGRATQSFSIVVAPGPAVTLRIEPAAATATADDTVALTVIAADQLGHAYPITNAILTTQDPLGSVDGGVYRPGKSGAWEIKAMTGALSATSSITVIPGKVASLSVNPNTNPELVAVGAKRSFTIQGFDAKNNPITNLPVAWSVSGGIGEIGKDGVFTAITAGEGRVKATFGNVAEEIAVKTRLASPTDETVTTNQSTAVSPSPATNAAEESANTNSQEEAGTIAGAEDENAAAPITCSTLTWWGWLLVIAGYVAVLFAYYYFIRGWRSSYWWVAPLVLTVGVIWLFTAYRCGDLFGWWPWAALIAGILTTLFRPHRFESNLGQTIP